MNKRIQRQQVRDILERDRLWTAYALADLDPMYADGAHWYIEGQAVILHYQSLDPPVLFLYGPSPSIDELMPKVPGGQVQFMVRGSNRQPLMKRLKPDKEVSMWRMALDPASFSQQPAAGCQPLGARNLAAIQDLIKNQPDQPDAFSEFQLAHGIFFGKWVDDELVAIAGTHVLSTVMDVAALGNVFTHPKHRGQGHGRAVSAAVVEELLRREIGTIVLNVAKENAAALRIYRGLGFWPVCGYYEGVGTISSTNVDKE